MKDIIAERIKALMDSEGLNQSELAGKINVQQNTISRWLSKRMKPSINSL